MAESNAHRALPDGRNVEITYLDGLEPWVSPAEAAEPAPPPAATAVGATHEALHVCPDCGSGLVHPLDWDEDSPERWRILMRCPDCDARHEGVFGRALVERLDDELDRASAALLSDYRRLVHANMSEEVELLTQAFELDLIGAEDFRRQPQR